MAERALVTGGSGYFGCLLRERLVARGDAVRVLDLIDADDRPPQVEFVQGDIRDADVVRAACVGADVVYHNVAQVPLARDRHLFESVNVGGTRILLRAAREAGVRKVVHTSSSAIFGVPLRNPVDEGVEPRPAEAYGRAKLDAELAVQDAARAGSDVTIVRPRTILGHGRLGIFQILFDWVEHGSAVPVLGRGDNVYQFVHADDLADACIRAAGRPGFAVYHVGSDRFGTMRETLEALCAHAGTGSRVVSLPKGLAVAAMKTTARLGLSPLAAYHWLMYGESLWFEVGRAKADLGWQPRWSNAEMICDSYDWYLRNKATVLAEGSRSAHRSALRQGALALLKRLT
ncbi:MAG TPA: NAD-dependent epimerase/dehydratase family protein [Candidatus Binatia bacterium]|nr:NAD-dependent epimerase/dehydratase family protein [Candidatus Binatia bacterium]